MDSILISIKKMLGITEEYEHFDADLIMHINSILAVLTQVGVGPTEGFRISDDSEEWDDFLPAMKGLDFVKSFIHIRVKLLFDPPQSASLLEAMKSQADELLWRIQVATETINNEEENQNGE